MAHRDVGGKHPDSSRPPTSHLLSVPLSGQTQPPGRLGNQEGSCLGTWTEQSRTRKGPEREQPRMAQRVRTGAFEPQSMHTGALEMPAPLPALPEAQGSSDAAGQWHWSPAQLRAFVINAQQLPGPARFVKLPAAGGGAGDLAHRELRLPDKGQKRGRSQGDAHPIKGSYQRAKSAQEPRSPARNRAGAGFGFSSSCLEGWGRGPQGDPGLCRLFSLSCLAPPYLTRPGPHRL